MDLDFYSFSAHGNESTSPFIYLICVPLIPIACTPHKRNKHLYSWIWESLFSVTNTAVKTINNISSYHHFINFCLSYKIYIFYETPSLAPISHSSFRAAILKDYPDHTMSHAGRLFIIYTMSVNIDRHEYSGQTVSRLAFLTSCPDTSAEWAAVEFKHCT